MDNIADKVREIIVGKLGVEAEQVVDNASFVEDLGADSLDVVEMVIDFEEAFGIKIPDDIIQSLTTVGDAIKYIEGKVDSTSEKKLAD